MDSTYKPWNDDYSFIPNIYVIAGLDPAIHERAPCPPACTVPLAIPHGLADQVRE